MSLAIVTTVILRRNKRDDASFVYDVTLDTTYVNMQQLKLSYILLFMSSDVILFFSINCFSLDTFVAALYMLLCFSIPIKCLIHM